MQNFEPRLYDVKIQQLKRLDELAMHPEKLDKALGNGADAEMDDVRFLDAARVLYGTLVEKTLDMLRPGQPGYLYVERRRAIIAAIRGTVLRPTAGPKPDAVVTSPVNVSPADFTAEPDAAQPQQPL